MSAVMSDWQELLKALAEHPEWREELRRMVLTEELLRLPAEVAAIRGEQVAQREEIVRLAQAVERLADLVAENQRQVGELAAAQKRTEQRVEELAEAQKRTEQRVEELAEAQKRTEQRVEELAQAVRETQEQLRRLDAVVVELVEQTKELRELNIRLVLRTDSLFDRTDWLLGDALERRFRERAPSYFQRFLRRIRLVSQERLALKLDDALDAGLITEEERTALLAADVVLEGKRNGQDAALVAEVSFTVDRYDVERAAERAKVLEKVLQVPVVAVVGGAFFDERALTLAQELGVETVEDTWTSERVKARPESDPLWEKWRRMASNLA
ncbi:MAG: hypothetical protein ACP5NF_07430 [Thermoanaerobaculum sp.]